MDEGFEVAHCAKRGATSINVWMLHCPVDGEVMGEVWMTQEKIWQSKLV